MLRNVGGKEIEAQQIQQFYSQRSILQPSYLIISQKKDNNTSSSRF